MTRPFLVLIALAIAAATSFGCDPPGSTATPSSSSGVQKANITVATGADGLTVEQRNVRDRVAEDNKPGSIKHLYIISPYSGQVVLYSTVRGKVTSGNKRLTPKTVTSADGQYTDSDFNGFKIDIAGRQYRTSEVLQDDGTYGDSGEYLFWFDAAGRYHQHYRGNEILHISSQPIAAKSIIMNLESTGPEPGAR